MAEINFRTSIIGGYHKGDVLDYIEELERQIEELKSRSAEKENAQDERRQRAAQKEQEERAAALWEENRSLKEKIKRLQEEKMQEDVERQREEKAPEHQPAQQPEENSCYDPAKQALMDAYAALEAARARADAILLQADEEAEKRKEKLMGQFRLEMEKRGIAVLTSRYKIREQIEGLKRAKEELEQIRVCMEKASTRLPSESDDFYLECGGE